MEQKYIGSFVLALHSHLPYVLSHGKWPHGTDWLSEAAAETYIPILEMLDKLSSKGIKPYFTIGITPVLSEQLSDPLFIDEFNSYIDIKIKAAESDYFYFKKIGQENLVNVAEMWINFYNNIKFKFNNEYNTDIISQFKKYSDEGILDIITCGATHGYFPLLGEDFSIDFQIRTAVETHQKHFGKKPKGMWMPESAYRPGYKWKHPMDLDIYKVAYNRKGIEEFLMKYGIEYTFIDSHLLRGGKAIGVYADRFDDLKRLWKQFEKEYVFKKIENLSPYSLYLIDTSYTEGKPVTIFTRDPKTGLQVWSGEHGYPGDGWYMEFHKKHFPGGLRYWRVTGSNCDLGEKMEYSTEIIKDRINENSDHFAHLIKNTLKEYHDSTGQYGVLAAPYDTELFGHWWFEGPVFLEQLLEKLANDPEIKLSNAATECSNLEPQVTVNIPEGSWGEGGYHYIWLNEDTQWTWKEIYYDEFRLKKVLENYTHIDEFTDSLIVQLAREFLLLQSSDWQFLISTRSARDYAELRFGEHHNDFNKLAEITENAVKGNKISDADKYFFNELKIKNSLFKEMKIEWLLESFKSHTEKKK